MTPEQIRLKLKASAQPAFGHSDFDLLGLKPAEQELRPAAVLVPIIDRPDGATILLTRRTAHLRAHAGQIAFPGGKAEEDDASLTDTALREAEEEIGLDRGMVEVVGQLDTYRTVTNFAVTPIVGIVRPDHDITIDDNEVAEVFEPPIHHILDARNHQRHNGWFNGMPRKWWAMPWHTYYIWGATAGMLINLYERLTGEHPAPDMVAKHDPAHQDQ